jgi:hypothetical protein
MGLLMWPHLMPAAAAAAAAAAPLLQARVLLRLGRPIDVAERGLVFV